MIAPDRAQYKIPLAWLICAPRATLTIRQSRARIRRSARPDTSYQAELAIVATVSNMQVSA
jgi:hypothetical protein